MAERKEDSNDRRKREFAEAAEMKVPMSCQETKA